MQEIDISVVLPAYNEGAVLASTLKLLQEILDKEKCAYEIIVVNDGSTDETGDIINHIGKESSAIVPVSLSRNYGKEAALAAGLESSRGLCVIFIDADLQHPLNVIPQMLAKWRQGYDVVNAKKLVRAQESASYRLSAYLFNWIMSHEVGVNMAGASDYKLIDRQVADALMRCTERSRFFRGLVAWLGFRTTDIEFNVEPRQMGSTKWSKRELFWYSLQNLVAFSALPLKAVAYTGFLTALVGIVLLIQTLITFFLGKAEIGFTTVIAVEILLGGMIITSLGVISLYIAKIYDEQKARPLFFIKKDRPLPRDKVEE